MATCYVLCEVCSRQIPLDQNKSPLTWQYDKDNGSVMCRCPDCGGRLLIGLYQYHNPYKYCPYCGISLAEGPIRSKRKQVYQLEEEDEE